MFKHDPEAERAVVEWLEGVVQQKKQGSLHEWLKSGVVLCNLLNVIRPGSVKPPVESPIAFKQRENIVSYLEACQKRFMISPTSLFQTVDLFEEKDMNLVVTSLHYLAKEVGKHKDYKGPAIRQVVASADNVLINSSFVSGILPVNQPAEISQEEEELVAWVNSHLKEQNMAISRLASDLRDGVMLIRLLETLTGTQRLGVSMTKPENLWQAMQNASLLLQFIQQQTNEPVQVCRGQQLTTGQLRPIIELLLLVRNKFDRDFVFKSQNCESQTFPAFLLLLMNRTK